MSTFKTEQIDDVHLIKCPPVVAARQVSEIETLVKGWLVVPSTTHVFNLEGVVSFAPGAYRPFVLFSQQLKQHGKSLFCIGISSPLASQFKKDGLATVFLPVATIHEARKRGAPPSAAPSGLMDVEIINPFLFSVQKVLELQASLVSKPGKPYLKKPGVNLPVEIAGHISLICNDFKGSVTLCFTSAVFLKIYENMVGEKHEKITTETQDAAGELINIIFGQAKTLLNDKKGYNLEKALPTVLVGDGLRIHHQGQSTALILPFESAAGNYHVEILIERSAASSSSSSSSSAA